MKQILLVDDDPLVLRLYTKKLEAAGFAVRTAPDGVLAVKALSEAAPDLVILDRMMPRLSGEDVLRFMASKPALCKVAVVVLTSSFMTDQTRLLAPFRVSRTLAKGESTPARMLELVCQVLGVTLAAEVAPEVAATLSPPASGHDTAVVNYEARELFFANAPKDYAALRSTSAEFALDPVAAARTEVLAGFYQQAHHLAGAAGLARLSNIALLSGALEALLFELAEKPQFINPSTARTVTTTVDFLGELIADARAGRRPEVMSREVLVVDDDPLTSHIALAGLARASLHGQTVASSVAALELLGQKQFDLVLLDIEMPRMSGFELCRKLRALPGYELTPVIYVTAHSDFDSRSRGILAGGNDLIAKPILPIELAVKAVTHLIRSRRPAPTATAS